MRKRRARKAPMSEGSATLLFGSLAAAILWVAMAFGGSL